MCTSEEQERIFRGKTWSFLAFDVEIPNAGDFRASYLGGVTRVILNRDDNGEVHAFVNRCAHRGALVRRELAGNAKSHTCIYHQWCYDLHGKLTAIPFRRGIRGKGRMSPGLRHGRARATAAQGRAGQRRVVRLARRGTGKPRRLPPGRRCSSSSAGFSTRRCGCSATAGSASAAIGRSTPRTPATITTPACCMIFCGPSGWTARPRSAGSRWMRGTGTALPGREAAQRRRRDGARQAYGGANIRNDYLSLREPAVVEVPPRARRPPQYRDQLGVSRVGVRADQQQHGSAPGSAARPRRGRDLSDHARLPRRPARNDAPPPAPGEPGRAGRARVDGGWRGASSSRTAPRRPTATARPSSSSAAAGKSPTAIIASTTCRCAGSGRITPSVWGSSRPARCDDPRPAGALRPLAPPMAG